MSTGDHDDSSASFLEELAYAPRVAPVATFRGTARYAPVRCLGGGAFGVVYEVRDLVLGGNVALKLLRYAAPEWLFRFKRDFRTLRQIEHPNLVRLYELAAEGDRWLFTMELVAGRPFGEHVVGSHERLRRTAAAVARALAVVHAAGKLHRDLKPSNVMVDPDGRAVLLDFGLVADLGASQQGAIAGTPAYMSPERGVEGPLTAASDWYALGVILFEVLAGRLPFSGDFGAMQTAKRDGAPDVRAIAPDAPGDLADLCRDLLQADAARRPSGDEVLRRLDAPLPRRTATSVEIFVGRTSELETLRCAHRRMQSGTPASALIRGASGIGKSALVARIVGEIELADDRTIVLSGRCVEPESVPYKTLDSTVDELARALTAMSDVDAASVVPRQAGALAQLFPVLRQVRAIHRAPPGSDEPKALRKAAAGALRELFARLCRQRPVVVCIDDLQWSDADGAWLLAELLRPPDAPVMLFIGAYRAEDAATSEPLRALCEALSPPLADEVVLDALDPAATVRLAAERLRETGQDASRVESIAAASHGSPFFVGELARHPESASIDEVVQRRVAALTPDARRLLRVLACAGRPLAASIAVAVTGGDGLRDALATLESSRLLRARVVDGEPRLECYHDRIREGVSRDLDAVTSGDLHRTLGDALERSGAGDPEHLALHFREAGDHARSASWGIRAAERAAGALAFAHQTRLLREALRSRAAAGLPARDEVELRCSLAEALGHLGRVVEAADAYVGAAECTSGPRALELRVRATQELMIGGHLVRARNLLEEGLARTGVRLPHGRAELVATMLASRARLLVRGRRVGRRRETPVSETDRLRLELLWAAVSGFSLVRPLVAAALMPRYVRAALDAGEPRHRLRALCVEAMNRAFRKGTRAVGVPAMLTEAGTLAEELDRRDGTALFHTASGIVAMNQERWRDALSALEAAILHTRASGGGTYHETHRAGAFRLHTLLAMGRFGTLSRELPHDVEDLRERGNVVAWVFASIFQSWVLIAHGRTDDSRAALAGALARWPEDASELPSQYGILCDVQRLLYEDTNGGAAWESLERRWDQIESTLRFMGPANQGRALTVRVQSALAAAVSRPARWAAIEAGALRDIARIERMASGSARGIALALRGAWAASRGDAGGAALLGEAESELLAGGNEAWAAAAQRRLGALLGGEHGRAILTKSEAWMVQEGIADPARWTSVLLPG